jgi:hypothetical protein
MPETVRFGLSEILAVSGSPIVERDESTPSRVKGSEVNRLRAVRNGLRQRLRDHVKAALQRETAGSLIATLIGLGVEQRTTVDYMHNLEPDDHGVLRLTAILQGWNCVALIVAASVAER